MNFGLWKREGMRRKRWEKKKLNQLQRNAARVVNQQRVTFFIGTWNHIVCLVTIAMHWFVGLKKGNRFSGGDVITQLSGLWLWLWSHSWVGCDYGCAVITQLSGLWLRLWLSKWLRCDNGRATVTTLMWSSGWLNRNIFDDKSDSYRYSTITFLWCNTIQIFYLRYTVHKILNLSYFLK